MKHQRAQTHLQNYEHSMGSSAWTCGHGGEEGNLKRKQKLIDLRQSHFAEEFGQQWKSCRDLQKKHPVKEFDQTPSNNQQGALSFPHRGLTLEDFHVCFQIVVTFIQHLLNPNSHRNCIIMTSRSFCPCPVIY